MDNSPRDQIDTPKENNIRQIRRAIQIFEITQYNNIYDYLKNYEITKEILQYLDIPSLLALTCVSLKLRMSIKQFFQYNSYTKKIKNHSLLKKTKLYLDVKNHFQRRLEFRSLLQSDELQLLQDLSKLSHIQNSQQIKLLQTALLLNGNEVSIAQNVIPFIIKNGLSNSFNDIMKSRIQLSPKNTKVKEIKPISHASDLVNKLQQILSEYITEKLNNQTPPKQQVKTINSYKRFQHWKTFEKLKPSLIKSINSQGFQDKSVFDISNKNIFSVIIKFLESKDIFNLTLSNKKFAGLIEDSCKYKLQFLYERRRSLAEKHGFNLDHLEIIQNYTHVEVFLDVRQSSLLSNQFQEIPICSRLINLLMFINMPTKQYNGENYAKFINNFQKINKTKVNENVKNFLDEWSSEKIQQEITESTKNNPKLYQDHIQFVFLYNYIKAIYQSCQQNVIFQDITKGSQLYQKYLFYNESEIHFMETFLGKKQEMIPIFHQKRYPQRTRNMIKVHAFNLFE